MAVTADDFRALFDIVRAIDLFGDGPPAPPWNGAATEAAVRAAIDANAHHLPDAYHAAYVAPLSAGVARILDKGEAAIEAVAGAVYDHGDDDVAAPLRRFLAVVSNLYRSFLSDARRARASGSVTERLPPLAVFQHSGEMGPYSITADALSEGFGARVAVVSLPATYCDHPILWATVVHETGGHDVLHATTGLLAELEAGLQALFAGSAPLLPRNPGGVDMAALWGYWLEEAAADVCGVLNMGPAFGLNQIAYLAGYNARYAHSPHPLLLTRSSNAPLDTLDIHPVDVLRPQIIIGVLQRLSGLSARAVSGYVDDIRRLAGECTPSFDHVDVAGRFPTADDNEVILDVAVHWPTMREAARRVGRYVAETGVDALDGRSLRDIETWDDADEAAATAAAGAFTADGASAVGAGDDAQLLAGATLAALKDPGRYATITARLAEALDESVRTDPYWGPPPAR